MGLPITQSNQYGARDFYSPSEGVALRRMIATPYFTPAANPTDVAAVMCTAYTTILRVDRIVVSGVASTADVVEVLIQNASTNNTGTYSTPDVACAMGLNPSGALSFPVPASSALVRYYTANKSSNGNGVSSSRPVLASRRMQFATSTTVGTPAVFEWPRGHGPEIRDVNTTVVVNLAAQAMPASPQLRIDEICVTEIRVPRVSMCGDSLFAAAGDAFWKLSEAGNLHQAAAIDNLSTSGTTIDNYINGTGGIFYPQSAVVPSRSGDIVVLGYGITMDVENLSFAVLDRDQTTVSRDYVLGISGSRYFIEREPITDYQDLDRRMRAGEISDDEFSRAITPSLETLPQNAVSNGYWLSLIAQAQSRPDLTERNKLLAIEASVRAVKKADVVAAASKYLTDAAAQEARVMPGQKAVAD